MSTPLPPEQTAPANTVPTTEQLEKACLALQVRMIQIGREIALLKERFGPAVMTRLNISEFQAHALVDLAKLAFYSKEALLPKGSWRDLLSQMEELGCFEERGLGTLTAIQLRDAIPTELKP
jgi:hypothetical protein